MKKLFSTYFLIFCLGLFASQTFGQSASIESVTPRQGYSGQIVNIKGVGLSGADRVFFGSVEGVIISVTDQLIEAEVPSGATYDNVTVLNSSTRLTYSGEHFMLSFGGEQGIESSDFDQQINYPPTPGSRGLYDVVITDLDGDGKNDIIGTNSKVNVATFLRNQSTPGNINLVRTDINVGRPTLNITSGDLNGDGKPEVVLSAFNGDILTVLVNNSTPGNFSFGSLTLSIVDALTKRVIIKDLDLDGKPDLVVSDQASNNRVLIIKNTSTGGNLSFSSDRIELNLGNADITGGLEVEDLNGDGKPEIITNRFFADGVGVHIATNQSTPGNFSFSDFNQFTTPSGSSTNIKIGDVNGDNKPDVLLTLFRGPSAVAVFINETTGIGEAPQFAEAQNLNTDSDPWGIDLGDMDGDGKIDIIVSTVGDDKTVNIFNNDGSGGINFSKVAIPVTYINRNLKVGDIDGDSKPDIVLASSDDDNNGIPASQISILRNNKCIKPIITPEGPIDACLGNPVTLKAQNLAGVTFEWKQDGAVVKSSADNFIQLVDEVSASGSYTVTILSEGGSCSETSAPVEVTITSSSALSGSANLSADDPVCNGGILTLTSSNVGASTYEWRGPQDFTASGISVEVIDFNVSKAGKYFLDVYAGSCIVETKSIVVEVVPSPNFFVSQAGAGTYCEGETVALSISPVDADYSFQWFEGTTAISGATAATYNPTSSGDYYVKITDNVNGCPDIDTDILNVTFLAEPQVNFSLPSTACIQIPVSLTNESVVADELLAQYAWDFGDGNSSTEADPTHIYSSAGTFQVTLNVSYDGFASCSAQFSQQIVVNGALDLAINASSTSICEGDSITLSLDNTYDSYAWDTGETSPTITVAEGGTYSVRVVDANGCEGSSEISVQVSPIPEVDLTASTTSVNAGDTVSITAAGLITYTWFADSTSLNFTNDQIQFSPSATTTIRVEGQDANGCFGSAELVIRVEESNVGDRITPMRFFSPNNDAIAQFWEIENIENFPQCGIEIYDQQGNKIYEAKPYTNDWEGTANGSPVPDGVYYFVVRCEGSGIQKSGSITLLR